MKKNFKEKFEGKIHVVKSDGMLPVLNNNRYWRLPNVDICDRLADKGPVQDGKGTASFSQPQHKGPSSPIEKGRPSSPIEKGRPSSPIEKGKQKNLQ